MGKHRRRGVSVGRVLRLLGAIRRVHILPGVSLEAFDDAVVELLALPGLYGQEGFFGLVPVPSNQGALLDSIIHNLEEHLLHVVAIIGSLALAETAAQIVLQVTGQNNSRLKGSCANNVARTNHIS